MPNANISIYLNDEMYSRYADQKITLNREVREYIKNKLKVKK